FRLLYAVLGAQLKPFAQTQRPHAECACGNAEQFYQSLTILDLFTLVALIVVEDKVPILGREFIEAPPEAFDAAFGIASRLGGQYLRFRRLIQGPCLLRTFSAHLKREHPGNADAIRRDVANLLSFGDLFGTSINGLVSVFVGCGAASPFEEAHEVLADLEIPLRSDVTITRQRGEKAVESFLGEGPSFGAHLPSVLLPFSLKRESRPIVWRLPTFGFPHRYLRGPQCGRRPFAARQHAFIKSPHHFRRRAVVNVP